MLASSTVKALDAILRACPESAVTVSVKIDANTIETARGKRSHVAAARTAARGGLRTTVDLTVCVPAASFADITRLPGCEATITDVNGVEFKGRLLPVRMLPVGGLVWLQIGEPDRVTS